MLTRSIEPALNAYLANNSHKVFFLWGPRRSGKTTLLEKLSREQNVPIFNFDLLSDREKFTPDKDVLSRLAAEHKLILIDEVQNYAEAAAALKILVDHFSIKVIATGSSELRQKQTAFETLAGRFDEYFCLPLSIEELRANGEIKAYDEADFYKQTAENVMMYGSFPEVHTANVKEEKIRLLQNLIDTYVLKDIASIYQLKNMKLARDILTKIALQPGSEVSVRELAGNLGANAITVSNYIEIFIKNYILISLPSFRSNLKRAVSQNRKLYFWDLGVRNSLVSDFRPLELRPDKGGVFENFIISEMAKVIKNHRLFYNFYFYREYNGKEIDLVRENYEKKYICFEIKLQKRAEKSIFPLEHRFVPVSLANYQTVLTEAFSIYP